MTARHLLTLGDSFTYGEELENPIEQSWPSILAHKIGYRLVNLGTPGNSNPAICRQLLSHFAAGVEETPNLVVIGWSSPGRMEFGDMSGNFSVWPGNTGRLITKNRPWREELVKYINQYHSNDLLFEIYLQQVIMVQSFLKEHKIPYLMCNTVGNEYYKNSLLQKFGYYVPMIDKERFIGWSEEGMAEWTYGCAKGPRGHFLNEGHEVVANKIYDYLRTLSWVS